jgi:hypothetical protein
MGSEQGARRSERRAPGFRRIDYGFFPQKAGSLAFVAAST